jgi:ABC-type Mn2+/Zn2+ transport system permease subunit
MLDPLIASRAVHFASSLVVGGAAMFSAFVARPVHADAVLERHLEQLMFVALALALLSGGLGSFPWHLASHRPQLPR